MPSETCLVMRDSKANDHANPKPARISGFSATESISHDRSARPAHTERSAPTWGLLHEGEIPWARAGRAPAPLSAQAGYASFSAWARRVLAAPRRMRRRISLGE